MGKITSGTQSKEEQVNYVILDKLNELKFEAEWHNKFLKIQADTILKSITESKPNLIKLDKLYLIVWLSIILNLISIALFFKGA